MKNVQRLLAIMLAFTVAACGGGSSSSDYPSKGVTVVVPFSAGGGSDLTTRALVEASKDKFPKNISVENRTGGAGMVGMGYAAKAKADGYIIGMIAPELLILPHTGAGAGVTYKDFTPIIMYNSAYSAVTVKADSPYNTFEDFVAASKTKRLQVGNSGVGSIWHLAAAGLAQGIGADFNYVPFEGAAPAITDLLGGHIDAITVSYSEVLPQVEAGALKVLAILSPERTENPNIPTAKESGYDIVIGTWRGLAVPKTTPQEIVDEIIAIFEETSARESFLTFMKESNNVVDILIGDDFLKRMDAEDKLYSELVKGFEMN